MAQRDDRFHTRRARRDAELALQEEAWEGRQTPQPTAPEATGLATDQPREYAQPRSARAYLRRDRTALRSGPAVDEDEGDPRLLADPDASPAPAEVSWEPVPAPAAPVEPPMTSAPVAAPPVPAPTEVPPSGPLGQPGGVVAPAQPEEELPVFATRGERRAFLHARAVERGEIPETGAAPEAGAAPETGVTSGTGGEEPQLPAPDSVQPAPVPVAPPAAAQALPDALVRMRQRWAEEDLAPEQPGPGGLGDPGPIGPVASPPAATPPAAAPEAPQEPARGPLVARAEREATPSTLPSRRSLRPATPPVDEAESLVIASPGAQLDDPATVTLDGLEPVDSLYGPAGPGGPSAGQDSVSPPPWGSGASAAEQPGPSASTPIGGIPAVAEEAAPAARGSRRERRRAAAEPEAAESAPQRSRARKAPVVQAPSSAGITVVTESTAAVEEDDAHIGELVDAPSAPISARRRSERDAAESIGRAPSRAPLYTLGGFVLIAIGFGVAALIVL